ncbi:MAG: hypothetical protein ABI806_05745 [Candidatus Solibacter sp.]
MARIHLYAGLMTLVNLALYASVGIASLLEVRVVAPVVWEQPFVVQAGESNRAVAERVVHLLGLSLATPVHDFAIKRDRAGVLVLDFYHANGRHKVTVLAGRLQVEETRASLSKYLSTLHVTTAAFKSGDWRMQAWAWWNEFAMWCVAAMMVSGVWLWWRRRGTGGSLRRVHRWVGLGSLAVVAIYEVSAIAMAHRTWFHADALNRIHRLKGSGLSAGLGAALLAMAATGLMMWWRMPRERRAGTAVVGLGAAVAGGLLVWMRMG